MRPHPKEWGEEGGFISKSTGPLFSALRGPVTGGRHLDAAHRAGGVITKSLLLHGEEDQLIPLAHATGLRDLLTAADRSLVVIPNAGHNDILWTGREEYFRSIKTFAERHR